MDARKWIMKFHNDSKGLSIITSVRDVVKLVFQMTYNEDVICRKSFDFKLVDVVPNDSLEQIDMKGTVYQSLKNILECRKNIKIEIIMDG